MAQGIVLLLDSEADAAVRAYWQRLDDAGIPSVRSWTHGRHVPHISLVVAERVKVGAWLDALREGFFAGPPVGIRLGPVDAFRDGGWVYLGVEGLDRAAHRDLVTSLGDDVADRWEHYLPGAWVAHCTLAGGLDAGRVSDALAVLGAAAPIQAVVDSAAVIDSETGTVQPLAVRA